MLLVLSAAVQAASFEGRWAQSELPAIAESVVIEFIKDGNFTFAFKHKSGGRVVNLTGKWVKTSDKTIEFTPNENRKQRSTGVLLDDDTLEITESNGTTKNKFKRLK